MNTNNNTNNFMSEQEIYDLAVDMANKTIIWGNYKNIKEAQANFPINFVKIYNFHYKWFEYELIYWSEQWRSHYFKHNVDGEKQLKNVWIQRISSHSTNNITISNQTPLNRERDNNLIRIALNSLRENV